MLLPALYHWSPRERKPAILRRGLTPNARPSNGKTGAVTDSRPMVCLSPTPSGAWGLGPGIFGDPGEMFDLWQVRLDDEDEVHVLPSWGRWVREIRVANRIPKRRLWWVGERTR